MSCRAKLNAAASAQRTVTGSRIAYFKRATGCVRAANCDVNCTCTVDIKRGVASSTLCNAYYYLFRGDTNKDHNCANNVLRKQKSGAPHEHDVFWNQHAIR